MITYKTLRQRALEEFLNDEVQPLHKCLFRWGEMVYEVIPYSWTVKRRNSSGFVRAGAYAVREATPTVLKKYYKKVNI